MGLRKYNPYRICGETVFVNTNRNVEFMIDVDNVDLIIKYRWSINANGYVTGWKDGSVALLHRIITNAKKGEFVDHINGDKLDNRLSNLRIVTNQQNCMNRKLVSNNTSGVTGVYWNKGMSKWQAQIMYKRKYMYLGCYDNIEDAVKARKDAEKKYFGEFAYGGNANEQ